MIGSRTMVLAAGLVVLAGVSVAEAGPFSDAPNSRPIFGGRFFNGRFFRPFQKQQPTYTQPAPEVATEEPPLAAAPAAVTPAPAPATASASASAPLPVGPSASPAKVIESPRTALPVGPVPGVQTSLPPSR